MMSRSIPVSCRLMLMGMKMDMMMATMRVWGGTYIPAILPSENNFTDFNLKRNIIKKVALTEEDAAKYEITTRLIGKISMSIYFGTWVFLFKFLEQFDDCLFLCRCSGVF